MSLMPEFPIEEGAQSAQEIAGTFNFLNVMPGKTSYASAQKNLEMLAKFREELNGTLPAAFLKAATGPKITRSALPLDITIDKLTVLGGICSLFTAESEAIRKKEIVFSTSEEFNEWIRSWYPRLDQIHDTVGVPPKNTAHVIYVCEDSFFGRRVAKQTGLDESSLSRIFREVHEEQGAPLIENWLRINGYKGPVSVVYTSDLEARLETALGIWEQELEKPFKAGDRDKAMINLMYTRFWPGVLGIRGQAVVFEPQQHGLETSLFSNLSQWARRNPYGEGASKNLGFIGFQPFSDEEGMTRAKPFSAVPHRGNWASWCTEDRDLAAYAVNILAKTLFGREEPLSDAEIRLRIERDLRNCYEGEEHGRL